MRLFFAIPLPAALRAELAAFQAEARQAGLRASWPDPRGLHLTLAFLGEQDADRVPALLAVAEKALAGHGAFPLATDRLGGFPKEGAARVLWLGLAAQPRLEALAEDLRRGLAEAGVAFDAKPFKAHLTLARPRAPQAVARFGASPRPMAFTAEEVVLFQSLPEQGGHRYLPLGRILLAS